VDNISGNERDTIMEEVKKWNPRRSFPTLVFNDDKCIIGYDEAKITETLKE